MLPLLRNARFWFPMLPILIPYRGRKKLYPRPLPPSYLSLPSPPSPSPLPGSHYGGGKKFAEWDHDNMTLTTKSGEVLWSKICTRDTETCLLHQRPPESTRLLIGGKCTCMGQFANRMSANSKVNTTFPVFPCWSRSSYSCLISNKLSEVSVKPMREIRARVLCTYHTGAQVLALKIALEDHATHFCLPDQFLCALKW